MSKYDYILPQGTIIELPFIINSFENDFVKIDGNILSIKQDYHYNGCTGVLDFKGTKIPSGVHDILYQWRIVAQIIADIIFYLLMKKEKCIVALLYFNGVRIFGKYFY